MKPKFKIKHKKFHVKTAVRLKLRRYDIQLTSFDGFWKLSKAGERLQHNSKGSQIPRSDWTEYPEKRTWKLRLDGSQIWITAQERTFPTCMFLFPGARTPSRNDRPKELRVSKASKSARKGMDCLKYTHYCSNITETTHEMPDSLATKLFIYCLEIESIKFTYIVLQVANLELPSRFTAAFQKA
jgi:hypothetical protein